MLKLIFLVQLLVFEPPDELKSHLFLVHFSVLFSVKIE